VEKFSRSRLGKKGGIERRKKARIKFKDSLSKEDRVVRRLGEKESESLANSRPFVKGGNPQGRRVNLSRDGGSKG